MLLSKYFISTMKRHSLNRLPAYSSSTSSTASFTSRHTLSTLTNNNLSTYNNINNHNNNDSNININNVDCYISNIHDPYTNLAIEEYLLRSTDPKRYILFLWRNRNCVVIGRNQNPFQECNLQYMKQNNIPLVRRRSGGGAVFHDMGNSIYTIFMPREAFSRKANAELVTRALLQLDIPARVNERHDIVVNNHKVSGSAYKIISARAYHHGTMLIDADTEKLKGCLSKKYMNKIGMQSKGVESVPSPVTNLRDYSFTIDHQQFCDSVLEEFSKEYNHGKIVKPMIINDANILDLPEQVEKTRKELCTWDWMYGQTPEFTYKLENEFHWGRVNIFIKSRHGIITEVEMITNSDGAHEHTIVSAMSLALKGCNYYENAGQDAIDKINLEIPGLINGDNMDIVNDLNLWIKNKLI